MKTSIRYAREKNREKRERGTLSETHSDDGKVTRKGYLVYYYKKIREKDRERERDRDK